MRKTVLVTGAYGGMGRATAQILAKQGYLVFALDRQIAPAEENIVPIEAMLLMSKVCSRPFLRSADILCDWMPSCILLVCICWILWRK